MVTLVEGVGINNANYNTSITKREGGKEILVWRCPYYSRWKSMIVRCYSKKSYRTYEDCTVCTDWLTFSKFKSWMEKQDWEGKDLDKDLLKIGNKVYCPEYCIFLPPIINTFLTHYSYKNNGLPVGVSWCNRIEAYISRCRNPITGKRKYLGKYNCPSLAGDAWREEKLKMLLLLREEGFLLDDRVFLSIKRKILEN